MEIKRIRGIAKLEVWITDPAKNALKAYCENNKVSMKDFIDYLIRDHISKNAPHLLERENQ